MIRKRETIITRSKHSLKVSFAITVGMKDTFKSSVLRNLEKTKRRRILKIIQHIRQTLPPMENQINLT